MGKFIVIEGIDGCGKSGAIKYLKQRLPDAVFVCDPYNQGVCSVLRDLLKHGHNNERLSKGSELLTYIAARTHLLDTIIIPALQAGHTVISDRYDLSTYAYQGKGRGFPINDLQVLLSYVDCHFTSAPVTPDKLILELEGTS